MFNNSSSLTHEQCCQPKSSRLMRDTINSPHIVPVAPPLTEIHCAVIHRLFSDTSSSAASAMSSTVPRRFAAIVWAAIAVLTAVGEPSTSCKKGLDMSVGVGPGARVLTVMPWLRPSCPWLSVKASGMNQAGENSPQRPRLWSYCPVRTLPRSRHCCPGGASWRRWNQH